MPTPTRPAPERREAIDDPESALPLSVSQFEEIARHRLPPEAFAFVKGAASAERTARANVQAFEGYHLIPRVLRGSTLPNERDLAVRVLGTELATPILTAPIGALEMLHEQSDLAVARAARELGVCPVLSTVSSTTIEDFGAVAGPGWWFQLYWPAIDEVAESFVRRATRAGAGAIVVTVDAPRIGWRPRELEICGRPMAGRFGVANYLSDPAYRAWTAAAPHGDGSRETGAMFGRHDLGLRDLARLRDWTDLPIAVKGVLHPDDARAVVDAGADGVVVSNHGGRQIDGAIPAVAALAPVVAAVGDRADVLLDSGIRTGSDVLVALALGARAVFYGRPWVYALGMAGEAGVRHALSLLLTDLDITLGLAGRHRVADVDATLLAPRTS